MNELARGSHTFISVCDGFIHICICVCIDRHGICVDALLTLLWSLWLLSPLKMMRLSLCETKPSTWNIDLEMRYGTDIYMNITYMSV